MRLASPWQPRLAQADASPSERLASALAEDIQGGQLQAGSRLPAHRDLAWKLSIGVGSVTRAYAILERRGLTRSVKGRGTFVASVASRPLSVIDMAVNAPPAMLSERTLAQTLAALARKIDPQLFTHYAPAAGHEEHRRLMSRWLAGLGVEAGPDSLLLTNGAQQALALAFAVAAGPGGRILTEAVTYPGAIALARQSGQSLTGLDIDAHGLMPDALARALVQRGQGEGVLYVTPTMHNPTTATMTLERRLEIVRLCRQHDALIIEDDVYALAANAAVPALAQLAPERVFYANSLSKTLSPGLRIGVLRVPSGHLDRAQAVLQAIAPMVSPLSCAIMEQWLADGTADSVRDAIRSEAGRRRALAAELLGDAMVYPSHEGFHVWLPMARARADQIAATALAAGVAVTPPEAVATDPVRGDSGIRLCLGGLDMAVLTQGLGVMAGLLRTGGPAASAGPAWTL